MSGDACSFKLEIDVYQRTNVGLSKEKLAGFEPKMVRYYAFYSNKSRGLRKRAGMDDAAPAFIDAEMAPKEFRKNWARLIQKIYQGDPPIVS